MEGEATSTTRKERTARAEKADTTRTVLAIVALAAGFALLPRLSHGCEESLAKNEIAPDFAARLVANAESDAQKTISMQGLAGKPVLLDFWATWCGPCQAELPVVNAIAERFKDRGLVVVGVNTSDEPGLAEVYARKKRLGFPIVFDDANAVARKYHVESLPTLVLVSKEGKVVAVRRGITSDADLDRLVRSVL